MKVKGTKSTDFFTWLFECGIDTKIIPETAKKTPDQWVGMEFECEDASISAFKLKVDFKVRFNSKDETLNVADASVVEKTDGKATETPPRGLSIKKAADGRRIVELKAEIQGHPFQKYPRNAPCYCGSAKKFKKCHYLSTPVYCEAKEEANLKRLLEWFESNLAQMNEGEYSEFCRNYFARQAQPAEVTNSPT